MATQPPRILTLAGAALIVLLTTLAYLPALHGGFIIDDNVLLTENALVKAPDGLYRIWFTTEPIDYWPVFNSSFWIEWRLWGMNPTGYHVTNLLLHILEALLIWVLLLRLKIPGAFVAALLFAVHPVNVESVAWISQRKNLLALLFAQLSVLAYVVSGFAGESRSAQRHGCYAASLLAFVLAMLSKATVVVVPLVLSGIVCWRRRPTRRDGLRLAPFYLVSVALTLVNLWFVARFSKPDAASVNLLERTLAAATAVWFYLGKALLPLHLSFIYPKWQVAAADLRWWLPLLAVLAVTCLLWMRRRRNRALWFGWLYFGVTLGPVLGFTTSTFMEHSLVADHYQHLALIGVLALVAAGWATWREPSSGLARRCADGVAGLVVVALAVLTWQQSSLYVDGTTLFAAAAAQNPDSAFVENNLGLVLLDAGNAAAAAEHFARALRARPDYPEVHYNLARARYQQGAFDDAIEHYRSALRGRPGYAEYHYNLAAALARAGQEQEAMAELEQAVHLKPEFAEAHDALGLALTQAGRQADAMGHFEQALRLDPNLAEAHYNLGTALVGSQRLPEAIRQFEETLRLRPDHAEAHNNLGAALFETGRPAEASEHYAAAVRRKPEFADAQSNLGRALFQIGKAREAIGHLQKAVELTPGDADAHNALGAALAQTGQLAPAIEHLQEALRLRPGDRDIQGNLDEVQAMKAK